MTALRLIAVLPLVGCGDSGGPSLDAAGDLPRPADAAREVGAHFDQRIGDVTQPVDRASPPDGVQRDGAITDAAIVDASTSDARIADARVDSGAPAGDTRVDSAIPGRVGTRPSDLIDIQAIKGLSLTGLGWTPDGSVQLVNGAWRLSGSWSGPTFEWVEGGTPSTTVLKERAVIYAPRDFPDANLPGNGYGLVIAKHQAANVDDDAAAYATLANATGIVILTHGEDMPWNRNTMVFEGLKEIVERNKCAAVDFVTDNYLYALAKNNSRAITLAQLLAKRFAPSANVTKVALMGGSKEGYATWVASAVDDRIVAARPSSFQLVRVDSFDVYQRDGDCDTIVHQEGALTTTEKHLLRLSDWMRRSPGGQAFRQIFEVEAFRAQLLPTFFLVHGETGMHYSHDGKFFRLGMETSFLQGFSSAPFRYHRSDQNASLPGSRPPTDTAMILVSAMLQPGAISAWTKVASASAVDRADGSVRVTATLSNAGPTEVWLWWNSSPDRQWNDSDQSPWKPVRMTGTATNWAANIHPSANQEVAWFVEVRRTVPLTPSAIDQSLMDCSPIRFLRRHSPLSCVVPQVSCP